MTQNPTFALSDITNKALISSESNSANSSVCLECLSSIRILQTMRNQIKDTVNSRNVIYDINNAVKFIIEYMKHQVCDVQKKKAESGILS